MSFYISWIPTHLKLKAPLPSGIFFLTYCSNTELCKAFLFVSSYSFTEDSNTLSIFFLVLSIFWCDIATSGSFRAHYDSIYRSIFMCMILSFNTQQKVSLMFVKWVNFIAYFLIQGPFSNIIQTNSGRT